MDDPAASNTCLPSSVFGAAVVPYWDDLTTAPAGSGIYAATIGSSPNRQFVLEWRAQYFIGPGSANFEVIFEESSGVIRLRYGADANHGATATVGLQETGSHAAQFSCDTAALGNPGFQVTYTPIAPPPPPPPPPRCYVPRVIGLNLSRARARIRAANCSVGRVRRTRSRRVGRVLGQSPKAGSLRPRGTKVSLVVGRR